MLCQYKDALGKPREGAHSIRFFNIAIFDVLLTLLVSYIVARYTHRNFLYVTVIIMLLGMILHLLFCVNTTLTKALFIT